MRLTLQERELPFFAHQSGFVALPVAVFNIFALVLRLAPLGEAEFNFGPAGLVEID